MLSFSAFRVCQRHFITRLLIFVRKYRLIHCISIYYRVFCEGCESKKCKTPVVCVRACAREAHQRTFFTNDNISSFVYYFSLFIATTKGPTKKKLSPTFLQKRGRFLQKRWRFLQKRGSFFRKRGSFFRKRWRFSERCPTYYFISCDIHAILSLDIVSAQVLKLLPEEGNSRIIRIFVTL